MGDLSRRADGRRHPLAAETVVGRSRAADLRITDDFVSGLHASITWHGSEWMVKDLGSRNGTRLNGEQLNSGEARPLRAGDSICFGDPSATWRVVDDGGPQPLAVSVDGEVVAGADGLLALPSIEDPWGTIYMQPDGSWRFESQSQVQPVKDREAVTVNEQSWVVRLPDGLSATRGSNELRLANVDLVLNEAGDDRAAAVLVRQRSGDFTFSLGSTARVFEALIKARGDTSTDGWISREKLLGDLVISGNHLNVVVFRLRRQFADAGFADAANIVERDRGRLRLGTTRATMN